MPQDDWKFTAPTDLPEAIKAIILKPMIVDGIYGLGCSPDNGITNRIYWTIYGRKFYQEDADRLWPFLKNKITNAMSVDWDSIQNKPKLVTPDELEARLDKLSVPTVKWADIEDKPPIPSIEGLAKQSDLDNVKATADSAKSKAEQAQSTADANTKAFQNVYTKEEADQKYWTAEQEQNASNVKSVNNIEPDDQGNVNIDLTGYAKLNDIPQSMTWSQITGKPSVATKDDVDYLKTLIGSSSDSGDAGLTIEAIVELIKHHLKAKVDVNSGNLLIDVDGVSNGSIADAVATKIAQSLQFKLQGSDLVAEIGGTE